MDKILTPSQIFKKDLERGQKEENILADKIRSVKDTFGNNRYEVIQSTDMGNFSDYDMKVIDKITGKIITIELKTDLQHWVTGQVAIEIGTIQSDGSIKLSGIFKTNADLFAYKLDGYIGYYYLPTKEFIEYMWANTTVLDKAGIEGGSGKLFMNHLVRRDKFVKNTLKLSDLFGFELEKTREINPKNYYNEK